MRIFEGDPGEFEADVADLAAVPDWTAVFGPPIHSSWPGLLRLEQRVVAATGWRSLRRTDRIDERGNAVSFRLPGGGLVGVGAARVSTGSLIWSAAMAGPEDYDAACAAADDAWPHYQTTVNTHWGHPTYRGFHTDPDYPGPPPLTKEAHVTRRVTGWTRPGATAALAIRGGTHGYEPYFPSLNIHFTIYATDKPA